MFESALITLREGFEAALIVAIVLGYVRRSGRVGATRGVWTGVGAAVAVSLGLGLALQGIFDGLEGPTRLRAFAAIAFAAAAVLTWMIFWMRKQARNIKGELEGQLQDAMSTGSLVAVAAVAFFAVLREGIETVLFLVAALSGAGTTSVAIGGVIGLVVAVLLALAIYVGGKRVPMRTFFNATGLLLIVFAAGLLSRSIFFLQPQGSGDLGSLDMAAFDLTGQAWLTTNTQVGRFLAGILGWDPRPSIEQLLAYLLYLVPVTVAFRWDVVTSWVDRWGSRTVQPQRQHG